MAVTHGMDADQVEAMGRDLQRQAARLGAVVRRNDALLQRGRWQGRSGHRFRQEWWPRHRARLLDLERDLHRFGQSAVNQASEQRRVSSPAGRASSSTGSPPSAAHVVGSSTFSRDRFFGVGGRGVDGYEVDIIELSDGRFIVRVVTSSGFEANADDTLAVASLAAPQARALAALGGVVGGSMSLFGVSQQAEFLVGSREDAELLRARLRERADDYGGLHGLNYSEIIDEAQEAQREGMGISVSSADRTRDGDGLTGSVGSGPFAVGAEGALSSTSHGYDRVESTVRDSLTVVDPSMSATVNGMTIQGSVSQQITVLRDYHGNVVGLSVTETVAPVLEGSISSNDLIGDIVDHGARRAPGVGSITALVGAEGSLTTGIVTHTTTTYDFSSPAAHQLLTMQGCTDPDAPLSATAIQALHDRLRGAASGGSTLVEVFHSESGTSGGRFLSYESQTSEGSTCLIGRHETTF